MRCLEQVAWGRLGAGSPSPADVCLIESLFEYSNSAWSLRPRAIWLGGDPAPEGLALETQALIIRKCEAK